MRAILVDPAARTVTEVDYCGGDDPRHICALIGAESLDSGRLATFDGVQALAFVDDSGLLRSNACFRFEGYAHPLAGKALILGCDRFGNTVACPLTREEVEARIRWVAQAHALAAERAQRAIDAAYYRSMGCEVETDESGLVNVITQPERR
jgi:hypothetical protein